MQRIALLVAAGLFSAPTLAAETGTIRGRGVLVTVSTVTMPVPGRDGHKIIPSTMDGSLVAAEPGSPFDKARYQIVDLVDTGGMVNGGYKTFTLADGAMVFARYVTIGGEGAHYHGTWEITGGTGRFEKASGGGRWDGTFLSDTVLIDEMEGSFTLP